METKMITIPFDVELAKEIQAGTKPGKIVTGDGKDVRIVCWDRKTNAKYSIVALVDKVDFEGVQYCSEAGESTKSERFNLALQVPEYTQYKDGDILAFGKLSGCPAIGVLNFIHNDGHNHKDYVALSSSCALVFNSDNWTIANIRYATEEEKQQLIDALKASTDPRSKEYLKRFFGIEEKPKCKFEPFQKVLVRGNDNRWAADFFSHFDFEVEDNPFICVGGMANECIPYNDQTRHLLGTTDNWEE